MDPYFIPRLQVRKYDQDRKRFGHIWLESRVFFALADRVRSGDLKVWTHRRFLSPPFLYVHGSLSKYGSGQLKHYH